MLRKTLSSVITFGVEFQSVGLWITAERVVCAFSLCSLFLILALDPFVTFSIKIFAIIGVPWVLVFQAQFSKSSSLAHSLIEHSMTKNSLCFPNITKSALMAPTEKSVKKETVEVKKTKKNLKKKSLTEKINSESTFSIFIFQLLKKKVWPDLAISSKAMAIMNSFMADIMDRIAEEAKRVIRINNKSIITSRDVQTAVRLVLPPELAKVAVSEGLKALIRYNGTKKE